MEEKNKDTIQWTDEQAHVINTRKGNLLVSAAAGSGKTAVLVERIIEMVTGTNTHGERVGDVDPVDVDELLVVTFTNAAAAQMKEKVGKALQKKIDEMSAAGEYDDHLIRQMTLINHAEICTIDSFCLRIVKEYFSRVQLDAAFDIADNAEMEIIRKDVLDNVMEMCYADDQLIPGFRQLVKTFARKEKDGAVTELVEKLVRIVSSYPEPYKWLQNARDAVAVPQWAETEDACRRKYIMGIDMVAAFADEVKQIIYSALNMAREIQEYTNEAYQMESYGLRIDRDVEMLMHMSKICNSQDTVDLFELKDIYEKSVRQKNISPDEDECGNKLYYAFDTLGRNYKKPDPELKDLVVNRRTIYRDMVMEIMDIIDDARSIIEQAHMMAPAIISLIDLTELYMRELMKVKMDKNLFEFHDIEEFAFQILCDKIEGSRPVPSEIGLQVAGRYREILVDEYQDSNFLQEYILGSVAGHGTGIRNMFMVGDVKQSIYGFRMARPDLFIGKYDSYRRLSCDDEADPEENGSCILLTRNFRSEINVLRTVNIIFSQLMMDSVGGIEYDDAAKLNSRFAVDGENGGLYEPGDSECEQGPESEYILIENKVKDLDPYGSYTNPQVEAVYIASRIDEIVNGESPLYVGHGEDRRKAEYRDIVILLRSVSTAAADFERVFADAGIPLYIESEKGYFDAAEISCLISMLSVIDNSYVDYDMAAVLRSPLVGLNEEELALIVGEYRAEYETEKKDYNARLYD
ncbi:MAG: UvrD-helicase domain-containing protein, partial [Clostridiales bacterium]|nr:UvrD-helicase domain-containing protein [Clostridiales bacterium]